MDVTMEESSGKETQSNTSANNEKQDALTTTTNKINEHEINNEMTINNSHKEGMSIEEQQQISNCKTLKRCLSVPNIGRGGIGQCGSSMTLRSAAAASALKRAIQAQHEAAMAGTANEPTIQQETPKKCSYPTLDLIPNNNNNNQHHHHHHHHNHIHIAIPRSNPSSREVSPAPMFNIFAPRARRYSASFSPSGGIVGAASTTANNTPLYLTPRVSQLRKEECADVNTREVNHEREVHSAIQMSQSWEDLTLVAENWSCKSDELSNPLQVAFPAAVTSCSSLSPTNNRPGNMRLPYGLSPWGVSNNAGNYGNSGGNMRQGGAGGQGMNAQAINLANNLLSNLFRNQNPPSLLDLPRGSGGGGAGGSGGMGNRNRGTGHMMNRGGGNRPNNRRGGQNNFVNRGGPSGGNNKPHQQHQHQKQPMGGGIRKQNSFDRAKKVLAKTNNKNNNNKRDAQSLDDSQHGEGARESPYANVPNDLFYCHLCKKHMWDALSFENHIKGRTHLMVREGIEESYRLKANMIRQEAKIAEQLKSIELDRLKRMGKSNQRAPEYCTMCDLHFHGHITGHRKSEDHLQLKKFLHPKCIECNEEFSTRIDYDSHLLSAEHLLKAAEKNTKVGERKRNTLIILTADDELKDIRQQQRRRKKTAGEKPVKKEGEGEDGEGENAVENDGEIKQEPVEQTDADGETKEAAAGADETKEDEELNETNEEIEAAPNDPEDCILDYTENDEIPVEVDTRLPKYNSQRAVGLSLIRKLECYECVLCAKFLDTENTAEVHSRTGGHHRNFLKFINEKASDAKIAQKRAAAALEFNERKKRRLEDNKETAKNGTEIKIENDGGEEGAEAEEQTTTDGDNLYNPAEVTGDDDDVEMAETAEQQDEQGEGENQDEAEEDDDQEQEFVEEKPAEMVRETEIKPEPIPEPVVKAEVKPVVVPKTTPVKAAAAAAPAAANTTPTATATTPVATTPAAAAANNNTTPEQTIPTRKNTAIRGGGSGGRGNPRGRGRGRYNRY